MHLQWQCDVLIPDEDDTFIRIKIWTFCRMKLLCYISLGKLNSVGEFACNFWNQNYKKKIIRIYPEKGKCFTHSHIVVNVTFSRSSLNELLILHINRGSGTDTEGQSQKNVKTLKLVNMIWGQISWNYITIILGYIAMHNMCLDI